MNTTPQRPCKSCQGTGNKGMPCPDGKIGCLVYHFMPCPECHGSGKACNQCEGYKFSRDTALQAADAAVKKSEEYLARIKELEAQNGK